jgi:predicted dehydrogenase
MAVLKAGKRVFVEKPMCLDYTEARKLRQAEARARGRLFVRHNRRFEAGFRHIREIIASGILGKVFLIKLRRGGYQRRDDWQTLIKCGGGQLLNWGPHIIDHALQFLDAPVKQVWSDLKLIAAVGDAEDQIKIVLTGTNGRVVDLEISGGAAIREPEYIVLGSKGGLKCGGDMIALRYLDPAMKLARRRARPGAAPHGGFGSAEKLPWIEKEIKVAPSEGGDMTSIWDALYDAVRKGRAFPVTMAQAAAVMRIVDLARHGTPFARKK